jgi:hypothetical protein
MRSASIVFHLAAVLILGSCLAVHLGAANFLLALCFALLLIAGPEVLW